MAEDRTRYETDAGALRSPVRRAWSTSPTITLLAGTMLVTGVGGIVGLAADPRLVTGAPVWAKTTKFSISIFVYAVTLLWMLPHIRVRPRLVRLVATAIGAILLFEVALIVLQAVRGRPIHFNYTTPLDAALFNAMAISITIFWFVNMGLALLMLRQPLANRALTWGVRLALLIAIAGMGQGYLMTQPTAQQMARMEAGETVRTIGGHTVGAPDGEEPGLPLLGWSTTHGDLRIGHFVGLHGLQTVALLGWWLGRRRERWLTESHRVGLVLTGAGAYAGLMTLVTWQALRAQPLLRPDTLTLNAVALLVGTTLALAGLIVSHARRRAAPHETWFAARGRAM